MAHRYALMPHIAEFAAFSRWHDARVLELGCGAGMDGVSFALAGADYTGIDLSAAALAMSRRGFEWMAVDGGLVRADATQRLAAVRQASFDLVYCFDALAEMGDPAAAVREIRRAIRPDGEFRLMLPAKDSWEKAIGDGRDGYSATEARALLRTNDFAAVAITRDHIFRYDRAAFEDGEYRLQPWFASMPPEMFRRLEQRFGSHLLIVAQPA